MIHTKHKQPKIENPAAFDNTNAAIYIAISPNSLKLSRQTGELCGQSAPKFKKLKRKVLYMKKDLDCWLQNVPSQREQHGDTHVRENI